MLKTWVTETNVNMVFNCKPVLQFLASGMNISTFIQSKSSPKEFGIQLSPQNHQCQCDLTKDINSAIILLAGKNTCG